jgi:tetratricopeptide (TPR) repeat protein
VDADERDNPPPRDSGFDPSAFEVTEADLARAPGMPWQRSLDDALALVQATGKPLLVCVNMDGEAASESLAARRYRDPEFIALVSGFIPVLASPDRRNVRDHDDRGRRVPDPKFGRLVNAEHIDIEPVVYERYFRENRVAPRHVGVSPEGEILFDLFLLNDLSVIDRTLKKHGHFDTALPDPATLDPDELLASPDATARERLEAAFLRGDAELRARLAAASFDADRRTQHPELLRLALRDDHPEVREAALAALVRHPTAAPLGLYDEALVAAAGVEDTAAAEAALGRALSAVAAVSEGDDALRARRLGRLLTAAATPSASLDPELWRWALTGAVPMEPVPTAPLTHKDWYLAMGRLEERLETSDDPTLVVLWAWTVLRAAEDFIVSGSNVAGMVVTDAHYAAQRATKVAPDSPEAWAALAVASHLQSLPEEAITAAGRALPGLVLQARSAMAAQVVEVLAQSRLAALYPALGTEDGWPAAWLADVVAAYDVLAMHPRTTEAQFVAGLDALITLELHGPTRRLLDAAVRRYPGSATAHSYLRWQRLRDEGADGLQRAYDELAGTSRDPTLLWFAGFAFLAAAERHVEETRGHDALPAYARAIEFFETALALQPDFGNALHYVAMAHAGRARIQIADGDLDLAVTSIQDAAAASPTSFSEPDGEGVTPIATARELRRALRDAGAPEQADELTTALAEAGIEL